MINRIVYITFLFCSLFCNFPAHAQDDHAVSEYQVKAVFLYNFSQFINWPDSSFNSPSSPFIVGIVGDDPFGRFLEEVVRNEKYKNHPIIIKRYPSAEEIDRCHILFISSSVRGNLESLIAKTMNDSALTISDLPGFAHKGGVIEFYKSGNKIRLRINTQSAHKSNLEISSKLLRLADIVSSEKINNR